MALFSLACFFLLSIPLAAYQAYVVKSSIESILLGYSVGIDALLVIVAVIIVRADWDAITEEAAERIVDEGIHNGEIEF